jgi:hypothetical protein
MPLDAQTVNKNFDAHDGLTSVPRHLRRCLAIVAQGYPGCQADVADATNERVCLGELSPLLVDLSTGQIMPVRDSSDYPLSRTWLLTKFVA